MSSPALTLLSVDPQQAAWDATLTTNFGRIYTWMVEQPLFIFNHATSGVPAAGSFTYCLMFISGVADGLPLYWSDGTTWKRVVPLATTSALGVVKKAEAVADVGALATTETSTGAYGSNEENMLTHLKADVGSLRTTVNALLASLRTATSLST